jgi:hypothetical protein
MRIELVVPESTKLFLVGSSTLTFKTSYMKVENTVDDQYFDRIPWLKILGLVRCDGKLDMGRNNRRIDFGYSGHRNSRRRVESFGVSRPELLKGTTVQWIQDIFLLMTDYVKYMSKEFGIPIFCNNERNELIAGAIVKGNIIENLSVSWFSCGDGLMELHVDSMNCKTYSTVVNITNFILVDGIGHRLNIILYAKNANCNAYKKIMAVHPMITFVRDYFNNYLAHDATVGCMDRIVQTLAIPIQTFLQRGGFTDVSRTVGGLLLCAMQFMSTPSVFYDFMMDLMNIESTVFKGSSNDLSLYYIYVRSWEQFWKDDKLKLSYNLFIEAMNALEICSNECRCMHANNPGYFNDNTHHASSVVTSYLRSSSFADAAAICSCTELDSGIEDYCIHLAQLVLIWFTLLPVSLASTCCMDKGDWKLWTEEFPSLSDLGCYERGSLEILKVGVCLMDTLITECNVAKVFSKALHYHRMGEHRIECKTYITNVSNVWLYRFGTSYGKRHWTLWKGLHPKSVDAQVVQSLFRLIPISELRNGLTVDNFFHRKSKITRVPCKGRNRKLVPLQAHFQVQTSKRNAIPVVMDEFAASLSIPPKTSILRSIEGVNLFNFDPISIIKNVLFSNETKQNKVFTLLQTKTEGSTDTFHCAGVNVPNFMETGKPNTLFPDAKFCLFPSLEHEKNNISRATILKRSNDGIERRFFNGKQGRICAMEYAALYIIFAYPARFAEKEIVRKLIALPDERLSHPLEGVIHSFAVFYKPISGTTKGFFLVGVRYISKKSIQGGNAYFCIDEMGMPTSCLHLTRPPSNVSASKPSIQSKESSRVYGILGHTYVAKQNEYYQGSSINFKFAFDGGALQEVGLRFAVRDAPILVFRYIVQNSLENTSPFMRIFQNLNNHGIEMQVPFTKLSVTHQSSSEKRRHRHHCRRAFANKKKQMLKLSCNQGELFINMSTLV